MVDPIQGVEYVTTDSGDIFKTKFDATFNKFDMISLAASEELVESVECSNLGDSEGQIIIILKNDVDPSLTDRMFQQGSLVIVDGSLFGSCDVAGDANKDFTTQPAFDGFVLIESVLTSGPEVTLIGEVGSLHYIFESLFITSSLLQRRKLAAEGSEIYVPFNHRHAFKQPVDEPVYLESELTFRGHASIDFSETSWEFFPKKEFRVACDFEFDIEVEFSSELHFKIDKDVLKPKQIMYPSDDPSEWGMFSYPIYSLPTKALETVVKIFLPKSMQINLAAGLKLGFPLGGKLETATQVDVNMGGINMKATTGKKRVEFRYNGYGAPSIKTVNEDPSLDTNITGGPDKFDSFTAGLKLAGFLGIVPQVVFESFGLATGSLGLHTGLFFETNFGLNPPIEDNPGLPKLYGICDVFHNLQMKLEAGLGDFFLWYKLITDKEKVAVELPPIFEYELKFPLVTACLFGGNSAATVDIEVDDLIVFGGGGEPNKVYVFTFLAHVTTATVKKIRFEWSPGVGAPDSAVASVSNGEASTSAQLSYSKPGSYKLDVKVYDDDDEENRLLASSWVYVKIAGADLTIVPPTLDDAEVGVQYTFELSASGLNPSEIEYRFNWSFGVGSGGTGYETVQVIDGEASISISHTYNEEGAFGLVASISEPFDDGVGTIQYIDVAKSSFIVVVGEKIEREYNLDACDTWEVKTDGGHGVTIDVWNIADIPPGAIFDMKFDTQNIPDKIYVMYQESLVEDTGWRGSLYYNGDPLFPGGVTHPGDDIASDMFTRLSQDQDSFTVTVVGPHSNTIWEYSIRCRYNLGQEYNSDGLIQRKRIRGHFNDLSISG